MPRTSTPPPGADAPPRPDAEQAALFDRERHRETPQQRVERIRRRHGIDADRFGKDATEAALDVCAVWLAPRLRDVLVVTRVLVSMHGTAVTDATNAELAARCGPTVSPQHVSDAVSRAVKCKLLERVNSRGGRGRRVLVLGPILTLNNELRHAAAGDSYLPPRGYLPTLPGVGRPTDTFYRREKRTTTTAEPLEHDEDASTFVVPGAECEDCGGPVTSNPRTGAPNPRCKDCNEEHNARRRERRTRAKAAEAPDRGPARCSRCGEPNRTNSAGAFIDPCDECYGEQP